ncbi:NUDIX domain-containing protein [Kitasatospora sp. NPDC052896]|uniref:NUDIX domain-containing protein n=1 Tax=Kitasatospora sp. NPDC052896 TaxID=3364061 RepID=UPI0037CB89D3
MTTTWLPEDEWLSGLVRAYAGASVLLTDPAGRVLLLRPSYRDQWQYPGGVIDPGEGPAECAVREVAEETGLLLGAELRLLVVEWRDPLPDQEPHAHPAVHFMFDGGTVPATTPLRLQPEEIAEARFFPPAEAAVLLHEHAADRLQHGLRSRRAGGAGTALLRTPGYLG